MRFFIDMDGVLCVWKPASGEEALYEKGFFATMRPHQCAVAAVNEMISSGCDVYLLSKYLEDGDFAFTEKNGWVDKQLPGIPEDHRIFVPHLADKSDYVPGGIQPTDVLLDDYTVNLREWESSGGIAVKFMNGVNGKNGSWTGKKVGLDRSKIIRTLRAVARDVYV